MLGCFFYRHKNWCFFVCLLHLIPLLFPQALAGLLPLVVCFSVILRPVGQWLLRCSSRLLYIKPLKAFISQSNNNAATASLQPFLAISNEWLYIIVVLMSACLAYCCTSDSSFPASMDNVTAVCLRL